MTIASLACYEARLAAETSDPCRKASHELSAHRLGALAARQERAAEARQRAQVRSDMKENDARGANGPGAPHRGPEQFKPIASAFQRVPFQKPTVAPGLWSRLLSNKLITSCRRWLSAEMTGTNVRDLLCPHHSAIKVACGLGNAAKERYLHANRIHFRRAGLDQRSPALATASRAPPIAGQSPQNFDLCERFLIHGLESGRGVFQFVSPCAHHDPAQSGEQTMIDQLERRIEHARQTGRPLLLGGRYRVEHLALVVHPDKCKKNAPGSDDVLQAGEAHVMQLIVEDLASPGSRKSMVLTQAGLRFDDNMLRCAEIERANDMMDSHVCDRTTADSLCDVGDPMVVSYGGIGRNATLICYREALTRLHEVSSETQVDHLLEQIVMQGRRDRGPGFIHSEAQLLELRKAVFAAYDKEMDARQAVIGDKLVRQLHKVAAASVSKKSHASPLKPAIKKAVPPARPDPVDGGSAAAAPRSTQTGAKKRVRFAEDV